MTKFAEIGHLDASDNFAKRRMPAMAVGRKAFLFVSLERAGHAAGIYCSRVESFKANESKPLKYLTHILSNARNNAGQLPTSGGLPLSVPPLPAGALYDKLRQDHASDKARIAGRGRLFP